MSKIDELARIMATSSHMVFFGGAGMSTELHSSIMHWHCMDCGRQGAECSG